MSQIQFVDIITQIFNTLNYYSNLLLIAITSVYVVLTWGMVREMRRAREAEMEPHVISTLMPLASKKVKLRIHNVGQGPALNIEAKIQLNPLTRSSQKIWRHPALISQSYEDLLLPGQEYDLKKLASDFDTICVSMIWENSFGHKQKANQEFDLKRQEEGWYGVGFLLPPDDIPTQLERIKDELSKIRQHLDRETRAKSTRELFEQYKRDKSIWRRAQTRIKELVSKIT